jgi:Helix-turn-helix domain
MDVICLEDKAFYALVEEVVERIKEKSHQQDLWVSDIEAMHLLNIKSKTTLQKLRDEGKIRFSQPQKKVILYDRTSISIYLEKHAHNTF